MKVVTIALAAGATLMALPSVARAAEEQWDGGYSVKATRRSGFVAAIDLGMGLGHIAGYPNEVSKIGDPDFRSTTGVAPGSTLSVWIGGALRDWFTFGLGLTNMGAAKDEMKAGAGAFILHIEAFPLWSYGGHWRDLAAYANFGAGSIAITGVPNEVDGGLVSVMGGGLSYELVRVGHFAFGPALESTYMYSQSADAFGTFACLRGTFYGGP